MDEVTQLLVRMLIGTYAVLLTAGVAFLWRRLEATDSRVNAYIISNNEAIANLREKHATHSGSAVTKPEIQQIINDAVGPINKRLEDMKEWFRLALRLTPEGDNNNGRTGSAR